LARPVPGQIPIPAPAADDAPPDRPGKIGTPGDGLAPANPLARAPAPPAPPAPPPPPLASGRPFPPIDSPAAAVGLPITPPPPAVAARPSTPIGAPQVESYDEETYRCQPNDSFRSISRLKYGSESYERALLLFNRSHPQAGDDFQQDPPTLRPGQAVYVPPLPILIKYFGAVGPDGATPAGPARPAEHSALPASGPNVGLANAAQRPYRVGGNGETFWEIARKTLNKGERWTDIYLLNKGLDPQKPIPPDTVLYLPPDAQVAPADAPPRTPPG
jgi:nucleoid-associated protein YgaU